MPVIKMIKNQKGSLNGITVQEFIKDKTYIVNDDLFNVFVNDLKVANFFSIKKIATPIEKSVLSDIPIKNIVPKDKSIPVIPENKNEYANDKNNIGTENFVSKSQTRRFDIMKNKKKGNKGKK